MKKRILHNHNDDGIDRRGMLECMAWAGTGVLWTVGSGVLSSRLFGQAPAGEGLHFVQISDSHIGFNKPANTDVAGTLQAAIDKINALAAGTGLHDPHRRPEPHWRSPASSTTWTRF